MSAQLIAAGSKSLTWTDHDKHTASAPLDDDDDIDIIWSKKGHWLCFSAEVGDIDEGKLLAQLLADTVTAHRDNMKYNSLKELVEVAKNHYKKDGEFMTVVDNDQVTVMIHPGWDEDGEEIGDPKYIYSGEPKDILIEALNLLGLNADGA